MNRQPSQFLVPKATPVVKIVLILSTAIFLTQLIAESFFQLQLANYLGFVPAKLLDGWLWQPITYAFLHAGLFHALFNFLILWSVGSEIEGLWGSKTFLGFFFVCSVGAALTYGIFALIGIGPGAYSPVIGSSGVVYGLLLAYGILFGDRLMYFFMLFPMPAKYFVALLGAVELISSVFYGKDGVAHLAHVGGMIFGFLFMMAMAAWRQRSKEENVELRNRQKRLKKASHLRLVPGEDDDEDPKTWN